MAGEGRRDLTSPDPARSASPSPAIAFGRSPDLGDRLEEKEKKILKAFKKYLKFFKKY